jgi:predicted acyl esterase
MMVSFPERVVSFPTPSRASIDGMAIDATRRVQSLRVPVSDGVRLAVDVWLPVEQIAASRLSWRLRRRSLPRRTEA